VNQSILCNFFSERTIVEEIHINKMDGRGDYRAKLQNAEERSIIGRHRPIHNEKRGTNRYISKMCIT
jgi:hypothetical protein